MPNYKKNFTLNSSLKIEKEKKLLANISSDFLAIKFTS